jgi:hypothetical protein
LRDSAWSVALLLGAPRLVVALVFELLERLLLLLGAKRDELPHVDLLELDLEEPEPHELPDDLLLLLNELRLLEELRLPPKLPPRLPRAQVSAGIAITSSKKQTSRINGFMDECSLRLPYDHSS